MSKFATTAGPGQPLALSVEVDAAWVTKPDIVAKLMPSKRWRMSHLDIRPAMYVRVDYLCVTGRLRLVFPIQPTLPIINGMSISFLRSPEVPPPKFHPPFAPYPGSSPPATSTNCSSRTHCASAI